MIDLELHQQLMKKWPGRIYATPERIGPRLRHLEGLLPMLAAKSVIELGSNAGLHAVEIMNWAFEYFGVEPNSDYRTQFEMTVAAAHPLPACSWGLEDHLFNVPRGYDMDEDDRCDYALVACVCLYLLSKLEVAFLGKAILPRCDTVIIQERKASRDRPGNTTNGLHTPKAITRWLESNGFTVCVYYAKKERFFEVVGRK